MVSGTMRFTLKKGHFDRRMGYMIKAGARGRGWGLSIPIG